MRFSLLALALLAFAATAQAQSPSFGIKAGLNTATILFDDEVGFEEEGVDKQARLGFVGGITADIPFTPVIGLRAEALYSQKGYAVDYDTDVVGLPFDGKLTLKVDYIDVPVLLNLTVPTGSALEVGLQAGVVPSFKINEGLGCSGFESEIGGQVVDTCELSDREDDGEYGFKSFDLAGALGATIGAGPFAVDLRYTLGFTDITDEDTTVPLLDPGFADNNPRNGVFSVAAVYRFGR